LESPLLKPVFDNQSICYIKYINDYQQVASKLIVLICASVAFLTFRNGLIGWLDDWLRIKIL